MFNKLYSTKYSSFLPVTSEKPQKIMVDFTVELLSISVLVPGFSKNATFLRFSLCSSALSDVSIL